MTDASQASYGAVHKANDILTQVDLMNGDGTLPLFSRRRFLGEAASAAAVVGIAAVPDVAHGVGPPTPSPTDNRPRLPLRLLARNTLDDACAAEIRAISPQIT